ncbi:hypothetical protein GALMADRAFT_241467, partial [Galerina marginata CBS 339.88]
MPRHRCYLCGTLDEKVKPGRRNTGRNGTRWTTNIGVIARSEIEEYYVPELDALQFCECGCDADLFENDGWYPEHVTRIVIPIMDIARPAKRLGRRRNVSLEVKPTTSRFARVMELSPTKKTSKLALPLLDDEEFEILSDSELWEDDWEEIHNDGRLAARVVTYASVVRGT